MRIVLTVVSALVFVAVLLFALLNSRVIALDYFMGQVSWPLSVYLIIALLVGAFLGLVIGYSRGRSRR